ncbi:MAG: class I SAM-dependent methyltransferase, partial [Candidatus Andersenbacteria bacterium]|nr:class I SAM-dependent methyltransferase [Candidatus Andersenbacteria bacterium]
DALDVLVRADRHMWIHQTNWLGEPILNLPQDMFALQEIIWHTRPEYVLEIGVAWGGSLLFYATLMAVLGGKRIVAVDTYVPDDLRQRVGDFGALADRITWIVGSSVADETLEAVRQIIGSSRRVLVVLDSDHSHEHVLKELRRYAPLVGRGHYLVCCDTIVEDMPVQMHRPRPWGPGNNPKTALDQFLQEDDRFAVDRTVDDKLLFTCNPGGYLVCRKD